MKVPSIFAQNINENMKKAIYLLAIALGASAVSASAQKNTFLVYGDIGFAKTVDAMDNESKNFGLNLGVGYQINQHWTVGVLGGYNTSRYQPSGATTWDLNDSYGFGPFVRFQNPINKLFTVYAQAQYLGYGGYTGNTSTRNRTTRYSGSEFLIYPAIGMNLGRGWALNFDIGGIGYASETVRPSVVSTEGFAFTFGQTYNIGLSVNIPGYSHKGKFKKHHNSEEDGYDDWKNNRRNDD